MKIVKVIWLDSYGATPSWEHVEDAKGAIILKCESIGYLFADEPDYIKIAPHYAPETEQTAEQVSGVMCIPRICVKEIQELNGESK